jgi:5'-deoxynucleotidase YfbR-like HD superfamily hydrolase
MSSDLIEYLAQDIIAEQEAKHEAKWQAQEAKWQARLEAEQSARLLHTERETLEALVSLRFPDAPMRLTNLIRKITDVTRLPALRADIPDVPDIATLEQRLRDAAG